MTNAHTATQSRLDDYHDGLLTADERREVDAHLAGCAACREDLGALRALSAAAGALPLEISPPHDLWDGIRARLEAQQGAAAPAAGSRVISVDFRRPAARPSWRRWAPLAAAAVLLVALSSGATALLLRARQGAAVATLPAALAEPAPTTSALVAFRPAETEYRATVRSLEAELAARRARLAPETVAIIEANLHIIDRAIAESRAALEADPSNPDLPLHLSGVYRRKVELLQSAISLQART